MLRRLPKVLQMMIWIWAVYEEARHRPVILDSNYPNCTYRIMPTRSLISSLMSACSLARYVAMRAYTVTLDVGIFPDSMRMSMPPYRQLKLVGKIYLNMKLENFHINHDMLPIMGSLWTSRGPSYR
ncbi:hypothetical protein F5B22DRAFT_305061 [Xylaria bambusicola]|uniref:uncharacterized protein n=1 Tax=Xylaria bambusicola TaxID=326684 RepID=UPI00200899FD|nr:uncharacterized protein F5B22DRAFT_305061 [Xylaria bambusicola]KAI0512499.1 hypothetical protein F5B22DRAFT_305061 [Xylaria bambusicola]